MCRGLAEPWHRRRSGPRIVAGQWPVHQLGRPAATRPARPDRMRGQQGPESVRAQATQDMNSDRVATGATAAQSSAPGGVPAIVAGIDGGKCWLDAQIEPAGHARRFPNDKLGWRTLHDWLRQHGVERAVFEPTGRYHRPLQECLAAAGVEAVAGRMEGLEATAPLDQGLGGLAGSGGAAPALRRRARLPEPRRAGTGGQGRSAPARRGAALDPRRRFGTRASLLAAEPPGPCSVWLPAPATAARTKIEISDDRWEAIKKVARRDGLRSQVVLEHILDEHAPRC